MSSAPQFSKRFEIPTNIPGIQSDAAIEVADATDSDVLQAIVANTAFPARTLQLGRISINASGGKDIRFDSGQGTVSFKAGAESHLSLGIFDKGSEVMDTLQLRDTATIGLALTDVRDSRYALFHWGYGIEGTVSGKHPIGMLGSMSFGVEGRREALYAVIHRFDSKRGANTVIRDTVGSFRLPRHVSSIDDLKPGTMLLAEVDGSVALSINAQLGYDFTFIREVSALGLTGDVGLRLEAGLKASVGFEVSGRYLLAVDRESLSEADKVIRLRLFKLSKKGWNFGLNLSAKVQGNADILPDRVDDLVKAVFGVHGMQVVKELQRIEKWTDPSADASDMVAGLVNQSGLDLLTRATGVDARQAFEQAKQKLLSGLRKFEELPHTAASALWSILEDKGFDDAKRAELKNALDLLSGTGDERKAALAKLLATTGFDQKPIGILLNSAASFGALSLLDRLDEVQKIASTAREVLNGEIIERLQKYLNETLQLETIRTVVSHADFDALNGFLVARLSAFFDEKLGFETLDKIKDTINAVIKKRQEIYESALKALNRRYDFDLAFRYQKTTSRTALLDVGFDMHQEQAQSMLRAVLRDSNLDRLMIEAASGVTLNNAVLTHEITRSKSIEIKMPYYSSRTDTLSSSLAKVRAVDDGGRVLFYELDSSDTVTRRKRYRSELAVTAALPVAISGAVRAHTSESTMSYRLLYAKENLRRADLEYLLGPAISQYFAGHFQQGGPSSFGTWLTDLDRIVEEKVNNGSAEFGDVLISLELTAPGSALGAWFQTRTADQLKIAKAELSRHLQRALKASLLSQYFQNIDNLEQTAAAAPLLVWASIPPSTSARLSNGKLTLNTDNDVMWDIEDPSLRRAMILNSATDAKLGTEIARARARLIEAGLTKKARFFEPEEVEDFQNLAMGGQGEANLRTLLLVESQMVRQAAEALEDISEFRQDQAATPSRAIERLAEFGENLTTAFNEKISSIYGNDLTRSLGTMLFLEASCALDPKLRAAGPSALLSLTILKEQRQFSVGEFINNKKPNAQDIAVEQRLLAAG